MIRLPEETPQRVRRVELHPFVFPDLLKESVTITDGLPEDAECASLYMVPERNVLVAIIESDEFPAVDPGDKIPETTVEVEGDY